MSEKAVDFEVRKPSKKEKDLIAFLEMSADVGPSVLLAAAQEYFKKVFVYSDESVAAIEAEAVLGDLLWSDRPVEPGVRLVKEAYLSDEQYAEAIIRVAVHAAASPFSTLRTKEKFHISHLAISAVGGLFFTQTDTTESQATTQAFSLFQTAMARQQHALVDQMADSTTSDEMGEHYDMAVVNALMVEELSDHFKIKEGGRLIPRF